MACFFASIWPIIRVALTETGKCVWGGQLLYYRRNPFIIAKHNNDKKISDFDLQLNFKEGKLLKLANCPLKLLP